jgi:hypothetical protein
MEYNTQNYWSFGLFPSSGILENRKITFRKLDLFPSSSEEAGKTPIQLGPLERANLNHWITPVRFTQLFNHLDSIIKDNAVVTLCIYCLLWQSSNKSVK